MKIILAGSTGLVGREVLELCLACESITSIVALSRRELPASVTQNPKLKVVILDDFLSYTDPVLQEINGADACIWTLGKTPTTDSEAARKVCLDYTLAAVAAFEKVAENNKDGNGNETLPTKKIRFVYCSGAAAERDQTKSLWFIQEYRRIRVRLCLLYGILNVYANSQQGQVENELLAHAAAHPDSFELYILRPGMVLGKEMTLKDRLVQGLAPSVKVDVLAGLMLDVALKGGSQDIFENSAINELGRGSN
ncbi:hypothetical protein ASPZODRAFT_140552 [Penicilliopsis zonata CBS 506.65]|uniref:NAD(P)-binding domain-containing protein n=1 Tax=Penicilliopsis zonata CBS 506.65 TaxID=1073090 RepID=A0A1L9SM20_9EURO|nr:hypothetical protein ASPZODRAFT_140552 [Penicilliopsis zonata CBS 506.65]OJJ48238.1 hypothetical protein ASPZODRAFT_140552 [Penicilliopsis zonata CBS 506.65]